MSYSAAASAATDTNTSIFQRVIPLPASIQPAEGSFQLSSTTAISISDAALQPVAAYLADKLRPATGFPLPVQDSAAKTGITLSLAPDADLGSEGYQMVITADHVSISAPTPAGAFYGIQTLRQLLPPEIDQKNVQSATWTIPAGTLRDAPRFAWRGTMLDVARHFFSVSDVKQYIDLLAYYKLNRFHLHLTDDQGWRIAIKSWPKLAEYGGTSAVGGSPGGYYTQDDYTAIVKYAAERFIIVVPEVDMPGHTNAALASYAELNCTGVAPALYTGTKVGFSSLCTGADITYKFLDDVIGEIAALTPGPYFHIGGDESQATLHAEYVQFVERVQKIVQAHGKKVVGWEEIGEATLLPDSIVQHWNNKPKLAGTLQGAKVIMSPASKAYIDMKYDKQTTLGLDWAGLVSVETAYNWDPAALLSDVGESDVLGVEAPLWAETIHTLADIQQLAFPRLLGYAEIGWSPAKGRTWTDYQERLAAQGPRLTALGVNFYRAPEISWK